MRKVDVIVVGQGIAGSLVHYYLKKHNLSSVIINDSSDGLNSSQVALGMANPITGRNLVKSWMVEEIFPFALDLYKELEKIHNSKFVFEVDVLKLFSSQKEANQWIVKSEENTYEKYLLNPETNTYNQIKAPFGYGRIKHAFWVDTMLLISKYRDFLILKEEYIESKVVYEDITITDSSVIYSGVEAKQIVFCEGFKANLNPYFKYLPIIANKGEIIDFETEVETEDVFNKNGNTIPLSKNLFKLGATFDRDFQTVNSTPEGLQDLKEKLESVFNTPYKIVNHYAGIRPTTRDRRPTLGRHPQQNNVLIFNGMGTKGVTLSPYFSNMLAEHMITNKKLPSEVDIERFKKYFR